MTEYLLRHDSRASAFRDERTPAARRVLASTDAGQQIAQYGGPPLHVPGHHAADVAAHVLRSAHVVRHERRSSVGHGLEHDA